MRSLPKLTVMVEPKRFPHSDKDVRSDESAQIWSCLGGLALVVVLGCVLAVPAVKKRIQAAREDARLDAQIDSETRQMQALIAQMKREGGEARRVALEIERIKGQRVSR